ncbi:MAG: caspase family protein [Lewinellaceae bacterium]|nr:caspase family protein [Phaeodactylibacter sp.]MCB0613217.1 caspase family protein [Phaeodactylibacter sp.]MCB9352623.1 caspase family protein [Lewinellaceae bacterium]
MRINNPILLLPFYMLCSVFGLARNEDYRHVVRPGKDYALFFANDDYRSHPDFGNLKNPVKDARAIARELEEMYGFEEARVYENYSRSQIYQVLQQWQKRRFAEDGQLFIFFSGHGDFWEFTQKG